MCVCIVCVGFLDATGACSYCHTNGTDTCCRSINCPKIAVGAIIGIILGAIVFVAILGALLFIYKKKRKPNIAKQDSGVFGYESLASQRILTAKPQNQPMEEFYEVKHPYPPQMGDELGLHLGDIVCVAMNFDDGWALGFNVTTGLKGVFPVVCVSPAPEELLEQLLSSAKVQIDDSPTSPTLHTPFFEQETYEMRSKENH